MLAPIRLKLKLRPPNKKPQTHSQHRHVSSSPPPPSLPSKPTSQCPSLLSLSRSIIAYHPLRPRLTPFLRSFELLTRRPFPCLGRQLHAQMTLRGLLPGGLLAAKILAMYATAGDLSSAVNIFRTVEPPALILYNALIRAYAWFGLAEKAVGAYLQMRSFGFWGDHFTYPFVLKSCAELKRVRTGKYVHALAVKVGLDMNAYVGTSLIDMYVKCDCIVDARKMFDEMPERDISTWNALIAGYMKAGEVSLAEELFASMTRRNVVTWTAMISGFVHNGLAGEALSLFDNMVLEKKEEQPNWVTLMSVLQACSHLAALDRGRRIHEMARQLGLGSDPSVKSALVTMYSRCGSLLESRKSFDSIPPERRDTSAWNAMVTAYSSHGRGGDSIATFESMLRSGAKPDEITFAALLSGCSHSGLVEPGIDFFNQMGSEYGVPPGSQHFACLVDLLGRAGRIHEAKNVITRAGPSKTGPSAWGALLAACQKQNDLETARTAAEKLFVLEPRNPANYVHLANMYADSGLWAEAGRVRARAASLGLKKGPGRSWTEVKGRAHLFVCGDRAHPQAEEIYEFLEGLAGRLREAGYKVTTRAARHDVSEEEKEESLGAHSERLAVAFAVLNTGPTEVVRVTKNIRVCVDCHAAIKAMSKVLAREILVRDLTRFHRFVDGECSCGDYW